MIEKEIVNERDLCSSMLINGKSYMSIALTAWVLGQYHVKHLGADIVDVPQATPERSMWAPPRTKNHTAFLNKLPAKRKKTKAVTKAKKKSKRKNR